MFFPVDDMNMTIKKGDMVAARCTMYNNKTHQVNVGLNDDDEMCVFRVMYFTEGEETLNNKMCFTVGPPGYYWTSVIPHIPEYIDKDASQL